VAGWTGRDCRVTGAAVPNDVSRSTVEATAATACPICRLSGSSVAAVISARGTGCTGAGGAITRGTSRSSATRSRRERAPRLTRRRSRRAAAHRVRSARAGERYLEATAHGGASRRRRAKLLREAAARANERTRGRAGCAARPLRLHEGGFPPGAAPRHAAPPGKDALVCTPPTARASRWIEG
jgi:hypothetical protein